MDARGWIMFERRLKIVLFIMALVVCVLVGRAAVEQIVYGEYWKKEAVLANQRPHPIETTRGSIKDRLGRELAVDKPCVDACVDYAALTHPPQPEWVKRKAIDRLKSRLGDGYAAMTRQQRPAAIQEEIKAVESDLDRMWLTLAHVSNQTPDEIQEIRESVLRRVQMRQRSVWQARVEMALRKQGGKNSDGNAIKRFLSNPDEDIANDSLKIVVEEQNQAHIILRGIETPVQNELGRNIEHLPGLVLRPGTHRYYPYADVACHLLGNLGRVNAEDLLLNKGDERRDYMPNDLIGRNGIESLAEPALRGARGQIMHTLGDETVLAKYDSIPGQDVRVTIDIDLQQQIQSVFASATLRDVTTGATIESGAVFHGAAVVLSVDTNEVLALVSYPTFDVNHLDDMYKVLRLDDMNNPLSNRATMAAREPGSTVKPLCGLAGITEGLIGVNEGIECKGYLWLDNKKWPYGGGRCWVANSTFTPLLIKEGLLIHHQIPAQDPHRGHDNNFDGFLTYSDGLERSCNVYFETVADKLGIERLSNWYEKFGLGRPTGIGISEAKGRLPRSISTANAVMRKSFGFQAGIGQGWVAATPIQMANATATIARNGIWMRPKLLMSGADGTFPQTKADAWRGTPEQETLPLPADALAAARDGMSRVVNKVAGTGRSLVVGDKLLQSAMICGKTGTAQIGSKFWVPVRDEAGNIVKNPDGSEKRFFPQPSTHGNINPQAPWYRETDGNIDHSWYVGFAPRDNPKIAFAVMVEYGGSGGGAAASVARAALEACIAHGYLQIPKPADPASQTVAP